MRRQAICSRPEVEVAVAFHRPFFFFFFSESIRFVGADAISLGVVSLFRRRRRSAGPLRIKITLKLALEKTLLRGNSQQSRRLMKVS